MQKSVFKAAHKKIIASFLAATLSCMAFAPSAFAQDFETAKTDTPTHNASYDSAIKLTSGKPVLGNLSLSTDSHFYTFKTSNKASVYECRFDALTGSLMNLSFFDGYAQNRTFYELDDLLKKRRGTSHIVTSSRGVRFAAGLKKNTSYYLEARKLSLGVQRYTVTYIEHPILTKVSKAKVVKKSKTALKLTWSKQANATKYRVQYRLPGQAWNSVSTKTNNVTLKNLKRNTAYQVRICPYCPNAYDKATNSLRAWGSYSKVWTCKTAK